MKTATIVLGLVVLISSVSAVPQGNNLQRQQGGFGQGRGSGRGNNNGNTGGGKGGAISNPNTPYPTFAAFSHFIFLVLYPSCTVGWLS